MKKADIRIGGVYLANVSGKASRVRIDRESPHGGWDATNTKTKRAIRVRGGQRLQRALCEEDGCRNTPAQDTGRCSVHGPSRCRCLCGCDATERVEFSTVFKKPLCARCRYEAPVLGCLDTAPTPALGGAS